MITTLRFGPDPSGALGAKLIREARFEPITDLPLSSVCMAANHARAQLSKLFGRELTLDVFAPVLVRDGAQRVLFENARVFATRGSVSDVFVVFRERDARRIAQSAFGEDGSDGHAPLSGLEVRALERVAREVAALCAPFSGDSAGDALPVDPAHHDVRVATYFELRIGTPLDAVIGIGLSKDPGPAFGGGLDRTILRDVVLDVRAQFGEATRNAQDVAGWRIGTIVRLDTKIGAATKLKVGGCVIASGDCGIRADSHAVAIHTPPTKEAVS